MKHLKKAVCHFGGKYFNCDCFVVVSDNESMARSCPKGAPYGTSCKGSLSQDVSVDEVKKKSPREPLA